MSNARVFAGAERFWKIGAEPTDTTLKAEYPVRFEKLSKQHWAYLAQSYRTELIFSLFMILIIRKVYSKLLFAIFSIRKLILRAYVSLRDHYAPAVYLFKF